MSAESVPNPSYSVYRHPHLVREKPDHCRGRGYLPHFEKSACLQMVTYRLADSLPVAVLANLIQQFPAGEKDLRYRRQLENCMDCGYGSCCLRNPAVAKIVREVWLHRNEQEYRLHAWVIMPNHVHLLLDIFPDSDLSGIVNSWKSISARRINVLLGTREEVWQPDYLDCIIRNGVHYERAVSYIYENPVNASLIDCSENWRWSSWGEAAGGFVS